MWLQINWILSCQQTVHVMDLCRPLTNEKSIVSVLIALKCVLLNGLYFDNVIQCLFLCKLQKINKR